MSHARPRLFKGTSATREFYDAIGWRRHEGVLVDTATFTRRDPGPILNSLLQRRRRALGEALGGPGVNLVECGSGGKPATFLSDRCRCHTAVDFSATGLAEAAVALEAAGVPFKTVEADITNLPFNDGEFDAAYSAHAIYHIDTVDGQAAALSEVMRVVRPGGRAIFVLANPFPIAFPMRLLRRAAAMTPVLGPWLNRLRTKPPLPYLPMPLSWVQRQLERWGHVSIVCHAIPSVWFDQHVSERSLMGQGLWKAIHLIETKLPATAVRLGCFVTVIVERSAQTSTPV